MTDNKEEDLSIKILEDLRRIIRAVHLNSKKLASQNNLTSPQIVSLIAIHHNGPLTVAELATQVHLSSSTMVGIIDRLESKKLVVRERSKTDRRQVMVNITEEGKKAAKKSPLPLQDNLLKSFSKLSDAQQKNLARSLDLLVSMLKAH